MRSGKEEVVEVSDGSDSIRGRYERFNTKLGSGAFKTVYKAFDTLEQIDVAWNCIDLSSINIECERQKIFKECEILRKLNHPNILKIADQWFDEKNNHLNFITNIVHDGSLSSYFRNRSINLIRIKKLAKQILSALSYLHKNNIIHRDLKGDNIFIEGNTGTIVIGDLGLSCNIISAHSIVGTPHFMAPELFKEDYDEMVDIWSFGMVILELVTQQIPYSECKGAFQAYQTIVSGKKPLVLSQISNPYIRSFIDICLNITAKCRPTAIELLSHPFLLKRVSDKILCHKGVKSKPTLPEPPPSPDKPIRTKSKIEESVKVCTLSEERIVVQNVDVINENKKKITMQIFSHTFPNKIMTVAFEYDKTKDQPRAVANEMVQALKLKKYFVDKIQNAILEVIEDDDSNHETKENEEVDTNKTTNDDTNDAEQDDLETNVNHDNEMKLQTMRLAISDQDYHRSQIMKINSPNAMNRCFSKENIKLKKRQETHEWLNDHELSELIPIFDKEGLMKGHLKDATQSQLKEMCDLYNWNVVILLKLKKAVEEIEPVSSQNSQYIEQEQTRILDELSGRHQTVSRDINSIKSVQYSELERSATECNNAIYQNSEQMIALVEQDRDKLLKQVKSLRDARKQQLEKLLSALNKVNKNINSTLQKCGMIAINNEIPLMLRLQNIQQIICGLNDKESKNQTFDKKSIDTNHFKLKLSMDLQSFVGGLEKSICIAFDDQNEFELHYNQTNIQISAVPSPQQPQISRKSSNNTTNAEENHTDNDNDSLQISIDDIKLEYNSNDFIVNTSPNVDNETVTTHYDYKSTGYDILNGYKQGIETPNIDISCSNNNSIHIHRRAKSSPAVAATDKDSSDSPYSQHSAYHIHQKYHPHLTQSPFTITQTPNISVKLKSKKSIKHNQNDLDSMLINGYLRQHCKSINIVLPPDAFTICWSYYHFDCELLKFSKIYKSTDGWRFYDGNTCIKRLQVATSEHISCTDGGDSGDKWIDYKWILAEFEPITEGIHCWRIHVRNPNKGLIVFGVCRQQMFKCDDEHSQMVYGVGIAENKWYPIDHNQHNEVQLDDFNKREFEMDMKLNSIKGQLVFCVLPKENVNDKKTEFIINGLPLSENNKHRNGWVPYFNSYQNSVGCQLKIASCPTAWYSKHRQNIFD